VDLVRFKLRLCLEKFSQSLSELFRSEWMIGGACGRQDNVCEEGQIISMRRNWQLAPVETFPMNKTSPCVSCPSCSECNLESSLLSIMWIGLCAFTGNMPFIWGSWYFDGIEHFTEKAGDEWRSVFVQQKKPFRKRCPRAKYDDCSLLGGIEFYRAITASYPFPHRGGMLCVKQPWVTPSSPLMFSWSQL